MRFNILVAITTLALVKEATADRLIVQLYNYFASRYTGTFVTDYGSYYLGDVNGCHTNLDAPSLNRLCMDFGNQRGHFQFNGQGRRCLKETRNEFAHCADDNTWATCTTIYYDEVKCTW